MGIFIKRPLCLFCFCFIGALTLGSILNITGNVAALSVSFLAAAVVFILSFILKKRKYGLIEAFIALLFVALAFAVALVSIVLPSLKEDRLCREDAKIKFLVVENEYTSKYFSKYTGKLLTVDGEEIYTDTTLSCEYEGEYSVGDCLWLIGDIEKEDDELTVTPTIDREAVISRSYDGFDVNLLFARLRMKVRTLFLERLDYDSAALSVGLLTGDKDDLDGQTVRDFRRSGLSHVLAVSGLHLAVILGAVEFVLRKIGLSKLIRCITLSVCAFGLLVLAGFSPSACRSVLMLLCAYFCFILSRESDALTSLGIAVAFILFISPKTVFSLSFWLSFLATFGLVTWLSVISVRVGTEKKQKSSWLRIPLHIFMKALSAAAVAFCASISICIISWLFFGEISVIGILANIVVTPICVVYLILSLFVILLGWFPVVGEGLAFCMRSLYNVIRGSVSFFSDFDFATVSLRYSFAGIIVLTMSITLLVLLIVKLKRKFIIACVPILAIAAFSICLWSYNAQNSSPKVNYINDGFRDTVVISENNYATVIDIGDGNYSPLYESVCQAKENYATYIDSIVLTHYHTKYISSLEKIFRNDVVRNVYIPFPSTDEETDIAYDIYRCVTENGARIVFYNYSDKIELSDKAYLSVLDIAKSEHSTRKIISFAYSNGESILSYADSSWNTSDRAEEICRLIEMSDVTILGSHGPRKREGSTPYFDIEYPSLIVCADKELLVAAKEPQPDTEVLRGSYETEVTNLYFMLGN